MNSAPIYQVLGRPTTFVGGRRLVLPTPHSVGSTFHLTEEMASALPPPSQDRSRALVWRTGLVGEPVANAIAALIGPVLPWRHFWMVLGVIGPAAIVLSVWSLSETPAPLFSTTDWTTLLLHYVILAGLLLWHELGHLAAAHRAGLRVDGLGGGLYLIFPALYSTISLMPLSPYRDRMKIYAAGAGFQATVGIALSLALLRTGDEILRFAVFANLSTLVLNIIPGARLDGHRMVAEVMAQPWSKGYRHVLHRLTQVSSIIVIGVGLGAVALWLYVSVSTTVKAPTLTGIVLCVAPLALLLIFLSSLVKGWMRPNV